MRCSVAITPDPVTSAAVDKWRERYDAFFKLVGPHMTVAFPDEPRGTLEEVSAKVAAVAASTQPFTLGLNRWASAPELLDEHGEPTRFLIERYPNAKNLIVLLASHGAQEFLKLRAELGAAIPQPELLLNYPPYLTIGQSLSDEELARAREELKTFYPDYHIAVKDINFYVEQSDGSWQVSATYRLGR